MDPRHYLKLLLALTTSGSAVPSEQLDQLQEKAQKDLVMVRQRLDETLNQEKRAMRCGLINKRRELISNMVRRLNEVTSFSQFIWGQAGRPVVKNHF